MQNWSIYELMTVKKRVLPPLKNFQENNSN